MKGRQEWCGNEEIIGETAIETRCYVKVLYSFRRSFIADIGVGNVALIILFFYICVHICINIHTYMYVDIHMCTNTYIHIYHVRTYVCVYTYIYTLISDPNYSSKLPFDIKKYACICTCTITTHARTAGILVQ